MGRALWPRSRPNSANWSAGVEAHIEEEIDVSREGETRRLRVRIEGGQGGEMVLTFDDITRLVTAQRNAAWRDVARRIAHEIKNPLTPIQLSAERLQREVPQPDRRRRRGLRPLHRHHHPPGRRHRPDGRRVLVLRPHARAAVRRPTIRPNCCARRCSPSGWPAPDLTVDLIEPLPKVDDACDGRMVGQALANILKNAGEAVAARRAGTPPSAEDGRASSRGWRSRTTSRPSSSRTTARACRPRIATG